MTSNGFILEPWGSPPSLDRSILLRSDVDGLASLWSEPETRIVRVGPKGRFDRDALVTTPSGAFNVEEAIFLGVLDGHAWFAASLTDEISNPGSVRDIDLCGVDREVLVAATAILAWHEGVKFCEKCGARLANCSGGFSKRCRNPRCGVEVFPRQDPAMIVAVLDDSDRLLLAHQHSWRPGYLSVLAGFLEAGESAEFAVRREVAEEASLNVQALKYLGSQPWPFPRSLMSAFVARASGQLKIDESELEYGRWFTRDEVRQESDSRHIILPVAGSAANQMVNAWLNGTLPDPES